jgi:tetratricopeptide (TPR) repeat protein
LRLDPNTSSEHPLEIDSIVLRHLEGAQLAEFVIKPELARLTAEIEADPMSGAKYSERGTLRAQVGRWHESAEDYARELKLHPEDRIAWFKVANCLLLAGDEEAYRQHCQAMVAQFKTTSDANIADSLCKTCLLRPDAAKLADLPIKTVRDATEDPKLEEFHAWGVACCALISYRERNYEEAIAWTKKDPNLSGQPGALTLVIRAMAEQQLGQADAARKTLAQAETMIPAELRTLGAEGYSGPLPAPPASVFHDWLTPEIVRREAAKLLAGGQPPKKQ